MLNQEQILGKWDEIKGGVRNLWGEITNDELERVKGNIQAIKGIVEQKYGETEESIKFKMDRLMDSFDNDTDKSLKLNDGEASYKRNPTAVRTSEYSEYEDEASEARTRSPERSEFEQSAGGAINSKQGIAGNRDNQPYPGGYGSDISAGTGNIGFRESDLFGTDDVKMNSAPEGNDDEYKGEEIFDDGKKEDPTYELRKAGPNVEDRIARH